MSASDLGDGCCGALFPTGDLGVHTSFPGGGVEVAVTALWRNFVLSAPLPLWWCFLRRNQGVRGDVYRSSPATAASRWAVTTATGGRQLVLVQGCLAGGWRIRRVLLDLVERGRQIWDQRVLRGSPGRQATGSRPPALCDGALLRFTKPWCDEAPLVLGFAASRLRLRRRFDGDGGCRRACRRIGAEDPRDRSVFFGFFGCFCAVVLGQLSLLSLCGRFPRLCVLLYSFPFG